MRTLKKSLSLVLVLAMVFSFCAFGTSAAYVDADKIEPEYTEAVEVLSALEILMGDERGFRPDDTLTRAEACVIITKMLGATEVAKKATCTFDDAANHWAANFIGYCEAIGVVSGVGDNKFAPDAELSGYAFALMVLRAMGYDPAYEGIGGGSWEIITAKLANEVELVDGMDIIAAESFTREMAAQIAFTGLVELSMVEYRDYNNGVIGRPDSYPLGVTLLNRYFNVDVNKNARDEYHNPANRYYNMKTNQTVIVVPHAADAVIENKAVSHLDLIAALNIDNIEGYTVTTYVDGSASGNTVALSDKVTAFCGTNNPASPVSGRGSYANVYVDEYNEITVVIVNTYLGQVVSVNKDGTVVIDNASLETEFALAGALKGDVVTYTKGLSLKGNGTIAVTAEFATLTEGNLTKFVHNQKKYDGVLVNTYVWTVDGAELMTSFKGVSDTALAAQWKVEAGKAIPVAYYADSYGNVLNYYAAPQAAKVVPNSYIYIIDVDTDFTTVEGWKDHDYSYLTVYGVNEKGELGYYNLHWIDTQKNATKADGTDLGYYGSTLTYQSYKYKQGTGDSASVTAYENIMNAKGKVIRYAKDSNGNMVPYSLQLNAEGKPAAYAQQDIDFAPGVALNTTVKNGDTKIGSKVLNDETVFLFVYTDSTTGDDSVKKVVGNKNLGDGTYKGFICGDALGSNYAGVIFIDGQYVAKYDDEEFVYVTGDDITLHKEIDPETNEWVVKAVTFGVITMDGVETTMTQEIKAAPAVGFYELSRGFEKGTYTSVYGVVDTYKAGVLSIVGGNAYNVDADETIIYDYSEFGNNKLNDGTDRTGTDTVHFIVDAQTNTVIWVVIVD